MDNSVIQSRRFLYLGVLIINLSLGISYIGLWAIQLQKGNLWRADFSAFYTSWTMVKDGKGSQIYNFDLEKQYQKEILGGRSFAEGLLPFNNPPHVALILAPLAFLSLSNAYYVWTLIQVIILIGLFWLLLRLAASWLPKERIMLLITASALPFMLIDFMLGAFSLLMLVCIMQYIQALRRNQPVSLSIWFTVGLIKPQVMVLPGILLLAARRWREALGCLLGSLLVFLSSSLALGWNTWFDYLGQLKTISGFFGKYGITPADMYNFRGFLALLLGKEHASFINIVSIIVWIGSIIVICWLWNGPWEPALPGFELKMALTLTLGAFFNLHANPQDGRLLIAPAALFYDYLQRNNIPRRAYSCFLVLCPLISLVSEFTFGIKLGVRIPVLLILILLVWIIIAFIKVRQHGERWQPGTT